MVASLKTKDNEAWMHLVRSTQPSVLKRVQEQAKAAVGIVDPEVQKVLLSPPPHTHTHKKKIFFFY